VNTVTSLRGISWLSEWILSSQDGLFHGVVVVVVVIIIIVVVVVVVVVVNIKNHDSSVGIALGYGLDDRGSRVRVLVGAGNFSLHHRVQNGSGAHPASYPMGTSGSFSENKVARAWSWPLTPII
jgi:hypothetical protein